MTVLVFN